MIYKPNLYTQTEFAKLIDRAPARVNQMIKTRTLPDGTRAVKITGAILIEVKR